MVTTENTEALFWLKERTLFGVKMGLTNMISALERFGNPHRNFKSVHVAGTNGKGTTSAFIANSLEKIISKVGLYTSPHLVYLNERISIQGKWISNEDFIRILIRIKIGTTDLPLTYFEVVTLIAFIYFDEQGVEFAIIETGLGGRLDATNVIVPEVTIITGIGKDHELYLGDSIEKITQEKCGIIKKNKPIFIGHVPDHVLHIVKNYAGKNDSPIYQLKEPFDHYLHHNYLLAQLVLKTWFGEAISIESLSADKTHSTLLARQSRIAINHHQLMIDGAHNEDGMSAFVQFILEKEFQADEIVFGCVADKKAEKLLLHLKKLACPITLILPEMHRGQTIENLMEAAKRVGIEKFNSELSVSEYLDKIVKMEIPRNIIFCGSLYLAGEVYRWLDDKDFLKQPFIGLTINQ